MSALPSNPLAFSGAAPAHIDWSDWSHINEASRLLGIDDGRLRTMCASTLGPRAQAAKMNPPEGGKATWYVHRSYDPRLRSVITAESFDPRAYSVKQIQVMSAKKTCVMKLRELRSDPSRSIKDVADQLVIELRATVGKQLREQFGFKIGISRSRLYEWDRAYSQHGMDGLSDGRGGDRGEDDDEAAWSYFASIYLHENGFKKKTSWRMVRDKAASEGWQWLEYRPFLRRLKQRFPEVVQAAAREPGLVRDRMEPRASMHPDTFEANQVWIGDHAQADVWCVAPGRDAPVRPFVSVRMDWRTQTIVGWVVTLRPDSTCIAAALRAGIDNPEMLGPPEIVWDDNGKDFRAEILIGGKIVKRTVVHKGSIDESFSKGIYAMLGITPHFAIPHNPTGKGRLELWFKNRLHDRFDRSFFNGYCGTNSLKRPEGLMDAMKRGHLPTLEEYCSRLATWIDGYNKSSEHEMEHLRDPATGQKLSPLEALQTWGTKRVLDRPEILRYLMLRRSEPRHVGKMGIGMSVRGKTYYWGRGAAALDPYRKIGRKPVDKVVLALDPGDIRNAWAFRRDGKFICEVKLTSGGGRYNTPIALEHLEEAARDKTNFKRRMKEQAKGSPLEKVLTAEEHAAVKARMSPTKRPSPAALKPIQTPLDDQYNALRAVELRRLAAGAECQAPRRSIQNIESAVLPPRRAVRPLAKVGGPAGKLTPPRASLADRMRRDD